MDNDDSDSELKFNGKKILVVEDDTYCRVLLSEIFRLTNAEVSFVTNASEALDFVENNPNPNYIMLDIQLPDMDGVELAYKIREKNGDSKIIAVTACVFGDIVERCYKAGMQGFISKPIKIDDFLKTMVNCN